MQSTAPDMEHYVEAAKGEARQALAPIRSTTLAKAGQKIVHVHKQNNTWILDQTYDELAKWHCNGELELLVCSTATSEAWLQLVSATKYQAQDAFLFSAVVPGLGNASLWTFIIYADGTVACGAEDVGSSSIVVKGYASAAEIEAMHGMGVGEIWGLTDNGEISRSGHGPLQVQAGDLVQWDGSTWQMFLHLDLTNYVTEQELQSQVDILAAADTALQRDISAEELARGNADTALQERIDTHSGRTDNPHQVTAAQVGAATEAYVDAAVGAEAVIRGNADESLQQQIDANRIDVDENLDLDSANPVENRAVAAAMDGKQDQLTEMTDQEVNNLINSL